MWLHSSLLRSGIPAASHPVLADGQSTGSSSPIGTALGSRLGFQAGLKAGSSAWFRARVVALSFAGATLLQGCSATDPQPAQALPPARPVRPNIVFILSDDHATSALGAYGSASARTPHLDALAREGMRFDRAFCGNAICAPARATLLTGKHSHKHGVIDNSVSFDGSQPTFPKALQAAGYQTALFGKWHLKSDPTGFDAWEVFPDQGEYYNPVFRSSSGTRRVEGYASEIITERSLEWLNARDPGRPFLLCLQHKAPHRSWVPGPRQLAMYRGETIPEPATLFDDHAERNPGLAAQEMSIAKHLSDYDLKLAAPVPTQPDQLEAWEATYAADNAALRSATGWTEKERTSWNFQRYAADYLRCVAGVDASVGRVSDWLRTQGLERDTLVIYVSDQGFFVGEHGLYDKRWMYEESLRIPLIMRWPGVIPAGSRDSHLVQNIDMAPTLLEWTGANGWEGIQGRSLAALASGRAPAEWRDAIYYRYYEYPQPHRVEPHEGIRTDRYKWIDYPRLGCTELFDLETDPWELRNLAGQPSHATIEQQLRRQCEELRQEYGVP